MKKGLQDAELRVMNVLWDKGEATASQIAAELGARYGYSKTTTYTLIGRCVEKGAVERVDPGFLCRPLLDRETARESGVSELLDKLYGGRADQLVAAVLGSDRLTREDVARLKAVVKKWSEGHDDP